MSNIKMAEFSSRPALDQALAQRVAEILQQAISERDKAVLVVSGGSTPIGFFQQLSKIALAWEKVVVTLADERWVDSHHQDSNEKLLRENLLINQASTAKFLPLKNRAVNALEGQPVCESSLSLLGQFDLVILGMGCDGHTASLFPEAANLAVGLSMSCSMQCIAVEPHSAPHQRISMTLPRLLNSRQIIVHITGHEKREILMQAASITDQKQLPVSAVIQQQQTPVTVYWAQ